MSSWKEGGELYLPTLAAAEDRFAIPTGLLARVAFQECSWRPEVINCSVKSSAGAVGIMQLEPRFFPGAGLNWRDDVVTGARELARLYEHFKDWQQAIAAYNFGQGHIDRLVALDAHLASGKELQDLPLETRNYVTQVFSDVPIRGAILNAA